LHHARFSTQLYLVSAFWNVSEGQSYGFYAFRDDNTFSTSLQRAQTSMGMSANFRFAKATSMSLNLQRNEGEDTHYTYDLRLSHTFDSGHLLAFMLRHTSGDVRQTDAMVTYTIPFALPVGRRKDVASLRGRVVDAESG